MVLQGQNSNRLRLKGATANWSSLVIKGGLLVKEGQCEVASRMKGDRVSDFGLFLRPEGLVVRIR